MFRPRLPNNPETPNGPCATPLSHWAVPDNGPSVDTTDNGRYSGHICAIVPRLYYRGCPRIRAEAEST